MKNTFLILLLSTLLFSCTSQKQTTGRSEKKYAIQNQTLTNNLKLAYEKGFIKGFSVAIVDEKRLLYTNGFGFTDLEQNKPYTPATIQNIASISKTLIAISLFKAQEMGKLNINDPINSYLPFKIVNPNHPEIPILIKHLAYHTSSIKDLDEVYDRSYVLTQKTTPENEQVFDYFQKSETNISLADFIKNSLTVNGKWYTKNTFSDAKPGEKREYSNIGSALCALIIESATGQDYRTFTKENILKPLKMNTSGWSSKDTDFNKRSRLFANKEKLLAEYSLITYPDGGFLTSGSDLGLYLSELIKGYQGTGTLLNKESYQKLFEKLTYSNNGKIEEYGIFMEFRNKFLGVQNEMAGHNGSDPGVFTAMYFNPKTKIGKVVLVNTDTDLTEEIWPEIKEIWKSLSDYETTITN